MKFSKPTLMVGGGILASVLMLPLVAPRAVHAAVAPLPHFTNNLYTAVFNQDVDSPARNPYSQTVNCYSASTNQCVSLFPAVPTNMRLVVQYIASNVDTPTPLITGELAPSSGFIPILHTLQGKDQVGNNVYIASQPLLFYYEAGQAPYFVMTAQTGSFEFMSGSVTLTGYLINLSE